MCAADSECKAFAFRTTKPACYSYTRVYMGVRMPRRFPAQAYSSGLSIVPKLGFVSGFKKSSFPDWPFPSVH